MSDVSNLMALKRDADANVTSEKSVTEHDLLRILPLISLDSLTYIYMHILFIFLSM